MGMVGYVLIILMIISFILTVRAMMDGKKLSTLLKVGLVLATICPAMAQEDIIIAESRPVLLPPDAMQKAAISVDGWGGFILAFMENDTWPVNLSQNVTRNMTA